MVASLITSTQQSTNDHRDADHGSSSPPSNDSPYDHWALIRGLTALVNQGESEQRFHRLDREQPADFSLEGRESVQRVAPYNLPKAHLIHRSASSGAAKSIFHPYL